MDGPAVVASVLFSAAAPPQTDVLHPPSLPRSPNLGLSGFSRLPPAVASQHGDALRRVAHSCSQVGEAGVRPFIPTRQNEAKNAHPAPNQVLDAPLGLSRGSVARRRLVATTLKPCGAARTGQRLGKSLAMTQENAFICVSCSRSLKRYARIVSKCALK